MRHQSLIFSLGTAMLLALAAMSRSRRHRHRLSPRSSLPRRGASSSNPAIQPLSSRRPHIPAPNSGRWAQIELSGFQPRRGDPTRITRLEADHVDQDATGEIYPAARAAGGKLRQGGGHGPHDREQITRQPGPGSKPRSCDAARRNKTSRLHSTGGKRTAVGSFGFILL